MASRFANDEVKINHAGNSVTLRASLRTATRLERLHDGFPALMSNIIEGNLSDTYAVVKIAATSQSAAERFLSGVDGTTLDSFFAQTIPAIVSLIGTLTAPDTDTSTSPKAAPSISAPVAWKDHYKQLFGYATGWLGWTPTEAWNATPSEIMAAYSAHIDMLKTIHGSAEPDKATAYSDEQLKQVDELGFDPAFDRSGLSKLAALQ